MALITPQLSLQCLRTNCVYVGMCLRNTLTTQSPLSRSSLDGKLSLRSPEITIGSRDLFSDFKQRRLRLHEPKCLPKPENPEGDCHTYTLLLSQYPLTVLSCKFKLREKKKNTVHERVPRLIMQERSRAKFHNNNMKKILWKSLPWSVLHLKLRNTDNTH